MLKIVSRNKQGKVNQNWSLLHQWGVLQLQLASGYTLREKQTSSSSIQTQVQHLPTSKVCRGWVSFQWDCKPTSTIPSKDDKEVQGDI